MKRTTFGVMALAVTLGMGACTGTIGDGDPDGEGVGEAQGTLCAVDTSIRRLTRFEYNNTVRELLNDTTNPASAFPPEEKARGFDNQSDALTVSQLLAEQYMSAAEGVSERATADMAALIPDCTPTNTADDSCAVGFVESFAQRAFRRPLVQEEIDRLTALFNTAIADPDMATAVIGIQLVIQAVLQSPHFLYRPEFGSDEVVETDVVALTDWELASKLSYMLWNTMPDAELFSAAAAGELHTAEQIAEQARRMIEDDRSKLAIRHFHKQWLLLEEMDTISKDQAVYPAYDDSLRPQWEEEIGRFVEHVIMEDDGRLETLLTANYSFLNAELAAFYGADVTGTAPTGSDHEKVELDPNRRAGVLTLAGLMATFAGSNMSSPVHRGKFVREQLMCEALPLPPNDLVIVPPDLDPTKTTREQFEEIGANEACADCHAMMNPVGFGFENYDAIGQWRDEQNGKPIDPTGVMVNSTDLDGPFDGAPDLARKLAQSPTVAECVTSQWFRFTQNRSFTSGDRCTMDALRENFIASDYNIKELLVALTQTDAFLYRHKVVTEEEGGAQ